MMQRQFNKEEIRDTNVRFIRGYFEAEGGIDTMIVVYGMRSPSTGAEGPCVLPMMMPFNDEHEKDVFADAIREICRRADAYACAFMSEAWSVQLENGEDLEQPPSSDPRRREIVQLLIEYKRDPITSLIADIKRAVPGDETSKGTLGKFDEQQIECGGRFVGFLPGSEGN